MDTENNTTPTPEMDLTTMNRKLRYYYRHRDDPVFRERMSKAKAEYYRKNKDLLKQKSLERYYALKNANQPTAVEQVDP
jgi:hypothetical protein